MNTVNTFSHFVNSMNDNKPHLKINLSTKFNNNLNKSNFIMPFDLIYGAFSPGGQNPYTDLLKEKATLGFSCALSSFPRTLGRVKSPLSKSSFFYIQRGLYTGTMVFSEQTTAALIEKTSGSKIIGLGVGGIVGACLDLFTRLPYSEIASKSTKYLAVTNTCTTLRNMGAIYAVAKDDNPLLNGALFSLTRALDVFTIYAVKDNGSIKLNSQIAQKVLKGTLYNVPLSMAYIFLQKNINYHLSKYFGISQEKK